MTPGVIMRGTRRRLAFVALVCLGAATCAGDAVEPPAPAPAARTVRPDAAAVDIARRRAADRLRALGYIK